MNSRICPICDREVCHYDEHCRFCGSLFVDNIYCTNHTDTEAEGICLICSKPFCSECGTEVIGKFFCKEHSNYELLENLVTIYGSKDYNKILAIKALLEELNLHPTIINKTEKDTLGDISYYNNFNRSDNLVEKLSEEIKILVPCQEVQEAEELLSKNSI